MAAIWENGRESFLLHVFPDEPASYQILSKCPVRTCLSPHLPPVFPDRDSIVFLSIWQTDEEFDVDTSGFGATSPAYRRVRRLASRPSRCTRAFVAFEPPHPRAGLGNLLLIFPSSPNSMPLRDVHLIFQILP